MALQTVLEKLQLTNEKNILVQGLPSSIEKQFIKLTFAKAVTPLLKSRRIDLALVFAISKTQLSGILNDVIPALHEDGKLWIAYPKPTSKIASDLCRDCNWDMISAMGFETLGIIELDNTWNAVYFKKYEEIKQKGRVIVKTTDFKPAVLPASKELKSAFVKKSKIAAAAVS